MRGSAKRILWSILIVALSACGVTRGVPVITPEERLNFGLAAWRVGNLDLATMELSQLATDPATAELGGRAQLLLAALELDPRNASQAPANGAALLAELLGRPSVSNSTRSLGEVLYLLARDLGAAAPRDTSLLPRLPGIPLATQLDGLRQERDEQQLEITRLQQDLKARDGEIDKLTKELERIRKALRP